MLTERVCRTHGADVSRDVSTNGLRYRGAEVTPNPVFVVCFLRIFRVRPPDIGKVVSTFNVGQTVL